MKTRKDLADSGISLVAGASIGITLAIGYVYSLALVAGLIG